MAEALMTYGLPGPKGDTGATGATGPRGPAGPQGPAGGSSGSGKVISASASYSLPYTVYAGSVSFVIAIFTFYNVSFTSLVYVSSAAAGTGVMMGKAPWSREFCVSSSSSTWCAIQVTSSQIRFYNDRSSSVSSSSSPAATFLIF